MLQTQTQHVFSHQHQYPQAEPSWLHQQQQQQQHHHQAQHHQQHAQAQAQAQAAAAAAAAQQQHYNRIAMAGGNGTAAGSQAQGSANSAAGLSAEASSISGIDGSISEESRKVFIWVAELLDPNRRETALMELSKKREQVPELALVIWHSFGMYFASGFAVRVWSNFSGVMTALLQEIISVYPLLNPSQLTAAASNRVCNALALLQCVASHNDTRTLFLNGVYPRAPPLLNLV
jgi:CCR4-NOT transcription complex subunit 9